MANRLKLQSSDGEIFDVEKDVIRASSTIRTMMEQIDVGGEDDEPIPLQNVNGSIMKRILQWALYHRNDFRTDEEKAKRKDEKRSDYICAWDVEFLKVDQGTLFEILLAANYLGIDDLLDAACKTVADQIKGKGPEEIRKTFNIQNDFTPEEEAEVRHENQWCEEK